MSKIKVPEFSHTAATHHRLPNDEHKDLCVENIRRAWAACGHEVTVTVEEEGAQNFVTYLVRSDLLNALPRAEANRLLNLQKAARRG